MATADGVDDDLPRVASGYFQNFGVTAFTEKAARQIVAETILDGSIDWSDSEVREVDLADLHAMVIDREADGSAVGICYKSGRAFFPST